MPRELALATGHLPAIFTKSSIEGTGLHGAGSKSNRFRTYQVPEGHGPNVPEGHMKMALEGASARAMSAKWRRVTPSPQMMKLIN